MTAHRPLARSWAVLLTLGTALLFTSLVAAQTGTVRGTITTDGEPLPAVLVTIEGTQIFARADQGGRYILTGLPPGSHTLSAQLRGFKTVERVIDVEADQTLTVDFAMELDYLNLETVIVTGTANPRAKIESSVAITTTNAEEIVEQAPLNTTDLLKVIPGFWVESSGGEGGNNVFARGIPQDGGFRYVAMYEDGLPVFEAPELAFANIDSLMRIDTSIETMEAVRGGSATIFASNAPGGMINFISKTGGDTPGGEAKFTVGDYDLFRLDLDYGGPLGENWRYHVGGFYRFDGGIRDPDFTANEGGQIKANVTRFLDNGYFRINAKLMDDHNIFYLPIPLQDPDDPDDIAGFDANFDTMTGLDMARVSIPTPDAGVLDRDLRNGVNTEINQIGFELLTGFGNDWTLKNATRYSDIDLRFNAIFSLDNPFDAEQFAMDELAAYDGETGEAVDYRYSYTNFPDLTFDPVNGNGNGLVARTGWWTVDKPLEQFVNDIQLSRSWATNDLTFGFYFSSYEAGDFWLFNNILTEVKGAPRLLDLYLLDEEGEPLVSVTDKGFEQYGAFHRSATHEAWLGALYASDEWQVNERFRLDFGLRWEHHEFNGNVENTTNFDLGDETTLADDNFNWGDGSFVPYDYEFGELSASLGANVTLNDNLALYGRATSGFRTPDFEQWYLVDPREKGEVEDVEQYEAGVKLASERVGLFAAVFYSTFDNVPFLDEVVDPNTGELVTLDRFASTETLGAEIEVVARFGNGFGIDFVGTFQNPEYADFSGTDPDTDLPFDFSGNQIRRIPEILASIKPRYTRGPWNAYVDYSFVDDRFSDDANNVTLPDYQTLDASVSYSFPKVTIKLDGTNLTNEIGLTEGNPRVGQLVGVAQDIYMARPILGRAFRLSLGYRF